MAGASGSSRNWEKVRPFTSPSRGKENLKHEVYEVFDK
jgi:hypothetical protein